MEGLGMELRTAPRPVPEIVTSSVDKSIQVRLYHALQLLTLQQRDLHPMINRNTDILVSMCFLTPGCQEHYIKPHFRSRVTSATRVT